MTSPSSWFTSEIQQMMFGFGDNRRPLPETAALVEEIVHQQMLVMIEQASDVATVRGDKHVGIEDVLFLLRKDKVKLKRIIQFYEVRELKNLIKSAVGTSEELPGRTDLSTDKQQIVDARVMGKNRQICFDFLSSIDQTGELVALFDDRKVDDVKYQRLLRAEMQSQGMNMELYMEFCQARQASFSRRFKVQRFKEWLQVNLSPDIVLNPASVELFSYLAYETVAQIVDLALLVKQDMRAEPGDPLSRTRAAVCVNYPELYAGSLYNKPDTNTTVFSQSPPYESSGSTTLGTTSIPGQPLSQVLSATPGKQNKKKGKKGGPATTVELSWDTTILPSDVREAMRRYFTDISPFASQCKINPRCSPWYRTLCS